ncbi:alpha/beta hydrolase [Ferrovibrio sp.]|uniref:alpha/beta fold hydrolase n=1 Tax=Ferrovibrio sp. TaxID=1917215 RepID=UPI0025BAFF70|nr:alpha/beta hydrolase [Ferrovibrio sp.]MBX3453726.1 alpha/beta hydrolase [Ferrovibrio sp.]
MADLVLLPGVNNTAETFHAVIAALPANIRGLALDCPPLESVEAIADALLPGLPARFYLGGFSFGGYVALAMLERAPERVLGIAMIASASFADTPEQRPAREAAIAAAQRGEHLKLVAGQGAVVMHPKAAADAALVELRMKLAADYGAQRLIAHARAMMARPDRTALLTNSGRSVLLAAAREDRVVPPALMQKMADAAPHAVFETIAESGHLLPLEQPALLAASLARWIGAAEGRNS